MVVMPDLRYALISWAAFAGSGSRRTLTSTIPGTMNFPAASMVANRLSMGIAERGPAATMRPPSMSTTESGIAGPPEPSIRVAPVIAFCGESDVLHPASNRAPAQRISVEEFMFAVRQ
jgi:hypothetical protein